MDSNVSSVCDHGNRLKSKIFSISINLNKFLNEELSKNDSQLANDIKTSISEIGTVSDNILIEILKKNINHINEQHVGNKQNLIKDNQIENTVENSTIIKIDENVKTQTKTEPIPTVCNGVQQPRIDSTVPSDNNNPTDNCGRVIRKFKHILRGVEKTFDESNTNPLVRYLRKMKGGGKSPPYEPRIDAFLSFITSFVGIGMIASIEQYQLITTPNSLVIGSFGATAVLLFTAIKSPLAQPRNLIFGHFMASLIGPTMQIICGTTLPWLAAALAVSLTMALMCLTNTVHPPAGATAIIAVYSSDKIHAVGYFYVIMPVGLGVLLLLITALITNNLFPSRKYPQYWF